MGERLARGYYGPLPRELFSSWRLFPYVAEAYLAGAVSRHLPRLPAWHPPKASDAELIDKCAARLRFEPWRPTILPAGYSIAGATPSAMSGDAAIIRLEKPRKKGEFEISQKPIWLGIEEELSTARVPFTKLRICGQPTYVAHGRYGGEPIDLSYWLTRQTVLFEYGGKTVELRETRGRGPGLTNLLRLAATALR